MMPKFTAGLAVATLSLVGLVPATWADDVSGADRILCSVLEPHICSAGSGCDAVPAADLNIPQFIVLDVEARRLSTTAASGENRVTAATTVDRAAGRLTLQGHEQGRAFSLIVDEATGEATFASAAAERGVVVFAACTPQ